jgi:hypothetical protein
VQPRRAEPEQEVPGTKTPAHEKRNTLRFPRKKSAGVDLWPQHSYTCLHLLHVVIGTYTHRNTKTCVLSLSLSLSLTHTHTQRERERERERERKREEEKEKERERERD